MVAMGMENAGGSRQGNCRCPRGGEEEDNSCAYVETPYGKGGKRLCPESPEEDRVRIEKESHPAHSRKRVPPGSRESGEKRAPRIFSTKEEKVGKEILKRKRLEKGRLIDPS